MPHFDANGDGKAFNSLLTLKSVLFTLVSLSSYPKASDDSDFKTVDVVFISCRIWKLSLCNLSVEEGQYLDKPLHSLFWYNIYTEWACGSFLDPGYFLGQHW